MPEGFEGGMGRISIAGSSIRQGAIGLTLTFGGGGGIRFSRGLAFCGGEDDRGLADGNVGVAFGGGEDTRCADADGNVDFGKCASVILLVV